MFSVKGSVIPSTWVRAVCHHLLQGEVTLQGLGTLEGCFLGLRSKDGVQELEEDCVSLTHQKYHLCPSSSPIILESRCAIKAPVIQLPRWVGKFVLLSRWQQNENRCHILHCPWAVSAAGRTCGCGQMFAFGSSCADWRPHPHHGGYLWQICCLKKDREGCWILQWLELSQPSSLCHMWPNLKELPVPSWGATQTAPHLEWGSTAGGSAVSCLGTAIHASPTTSSPAKTLHCFPSHQAFKANGICVAKNNTHIQQFLLNPLLMTALKAPGIAGEEPRYLEQRDITLCSYELFGCFQGWSQSNCSPTLHLSL